MGSHLIRRLVEQFPEAEIISVDNYFTGSIENHVDSPQVRYITGSSVEINQLWERRRLPSPDVTFHLGEYSRIVQSFGDFDDVWEFNIRGTKEVVTFCHQQQSLLLYAGSSSKFSGEGAEHLSPYSWTKAKNIEYIRNFSTWFGLEYVITYFYNVYGPGQIGKGAYATVIGIFEEQAAAGRPLTVVEPGTQTRDFTHVDDIVDGLIVCYLRGDGDGYELGTAQEWSIIDVARMFSDDIVMIPARQGERSWGKADTSQARAIGFTPKRSLPDYAIDARGSG